jgi:transposase-like protein
MDATEFAKLLARVDLLNEEQRSVLRELLTRPPSATKQVTSLLDGAMPHQCPACGSNRIASWGRAHGLPRYRCRDCRRTFNSLTATSLARLRRRDIWLGFGLALQEGQSVRCSANTCGVARSTAFRWRHRFLGAARQTEILSGIVEADETFLRRSYKGARLWLPTAKASPPRPRPRRRGLSSTISGASLRERVPVLIMRDRSGNTAQEVLPGLAAPDFYDAIAPHVAQDALLCSDGARAYAFAARKIGLHHEAVNTQAGEHVRDGVFHIQNVNAYDSRLKDWMCRFHGVATRYLPNYLTWRNMIERLGDIATPAAFILDSAGRNCLSNT